MTEVQIEEIKPQNMELIFSHNLQFLSFTSSVYRKKPFIEKKNLVFNVLSTTEENKKSVTHYRNCDRLTILHYQDIQ